eukprot:1007391-Karenia_brevis.AAC.1
MTAPVPTEQNILTLLCAVSQPSAAPAPTASCVTTKDSDMHPPTHTHLPKNCNTMPSNGGG